MHLFSVQIFKRCIYLCNSPKNPGNDKTDLSDFTDGSDPASGKVRLSVSPVWTGSAADYEKPSLHYVGSGEGAQVYGWGLYGSSSEKVARWYAEADADRKGKKTTALFNGKRVHVADDFVVGAALCAIEKYGGVYKAIDFYSRNRWDPTAPRILEFIKNNLDKFQYVPSRRNLYRQTFWAGKEENLLDWDTFIDKKQLTQIEDQLKKEGLSDKFYPSIEYGEELYNNLVDTLGSPKAASEFLYRAGIDGVTYIGDSSGVRNYVAFSDKDIQVDEHIRFSIEDRDSSLERLKDVDMGKSIASRLDEGIMKGEYRLKHPEDRQKILDGAKKFYDEFSKKEIPLSNGRVAYFMPDKRAFERGDESAWAEYCMHAVTSGGEKLPDKDFRERLYNHTKFENLDRIEPTIREERTFYKLDNKEPQKDSVIFFGKTHSNSRLEVITRLDDYGNVNADLTEVTVVTTKKEAKEIPPPRPLTEVVEAVAQHQAAGFSPSTAFIIPQTGRKVKGKGEKNPGNDNTDLSDRSDRQGERIGTDRQGEWIGTDENGDVKFSAGEDPGFEAKVTAISKVLFRYTGTLTMIEPEEAYDILSKKGWKIDLENDEELLRRGAVEAMMLKRQRSQENRKKREKHAVTKADAWTGLLMEKYGEDFRINAGPKYDEIIKKEPFTGTWIDRRKTERGRSGSISAEEAAKYLTEKTGKEVTADMVVSHFGDLKKESLLADYRAKRRKKSELWNIEQEIEEEERQAEGIEPFSSKPIEESEYRKKLRKAYEKEAAEKEQADMEKWLYDNVEIWRWVSDIVGSTTLRHGFILRPAYRFQGEEFTGSFISKEWRISCFFPYSMVYCAISK